MWARGSCIDIAIITTTAASIFRSDLLLSALPTTVPMHRVSAGLPS
jgi:hypothetical protein